jgi:hypothetical protein
MLRSLTPPDWPSWTRWCGAEPWVHKRCWPTTRKPSGAVTNSSPSLTKTSWKGSPAASPCCSIHHLPVLVSSHFIPSGSAVTQEVPTLGCTACVHASTTCTSRTVVYFRDHVLIRLLKPQKGDGPSRLASLASTNSDALRAHFRQLTAAFLEPFDRFMMPAAPPEGRPPYATPFPPLALRICFLPCSSLTKQVCQRPT